LTSFHREPARQTAGVTNGVTEITELVKRL